MQRFRTGRNLTKVILEVRTDNTQTISHRRFKKNTMKPNPKFAIETKNKIYRFPQSGATLQETSTLLLASETENLMLFLFAKNTTL